MSTHAEENHGAEFNQEHASDTVASATTDSKTPPGSANLSALPSPTARSPDLQKQSQPFADVGWACERGLLPKISGVPVGLSLQVRALSKFFNTNEWNTFALSSFTKLTEVLCSYCRAHEFARSCFCARSTAAQEGEA